MQRGCLCLRHERHDRLEPHRDDEHVRRRHPVPHLRGHRRLGQLPLAGCPEQDHGDLRELLLEWRCARQFRGDRCERHRLPRALPGRGDAVLPDARPHLERLGLDGQPRRQEPAMTRLTWRGPAALAASALAGVAIAAAAASPARPSGAQGSAQALLAAPGQAPTADGLPPATARARALGRASAIPLPAGGNFNGIDWWVDGGSWASSAIEGMLEYNAACQWLRAWRDGREAQLALNVLSAASGWPAMRGTESGELLTRVAAQARAGGGRA